MMDLKNKVALVTGASSGIGAAIVIKLMELGMKVVGFARRKERVEELKKGYEHQLFVYQGDVTKQEDILKALTWTQQNVGPLYVLVNNAGVAREKPIDIATNQDWKDVLDTNLFGLTIFTKEGIKIMRENKTDGIIININSVCGHAVKPSGHAIYNASKYGVTAFTEAIRLELARTGSKIRITSLSPGLIESEMTTHYLSTLPHIGSDEIANGIEYIVTQNPTVNIAELTIRPVGETHF